MDFFLRKFITEDLKTLLNNGKNDVGELTQR